MTSNGSQTHDPYDGLLTRRVLEKLYTVADLERHIVEAVKYGIRMERARILSATQHLTYDQDEVISERETNP